MKVATKQQLQLAAAVPLSPMWISSIIETQRGNPQTGKWGGAAVYKSGDEPNSVRSADANNVGQQVVVDLNDPNQTPGEPIPFSWKNFLSFNEGGIIPFPTIN